MSRRCPACGTDYPDEIAFCGHDGTVNIEVTPDGEDVDPRLGEKLGDYIVVAHVADGAMGAVYEARNAETRARVAIKVLHPDVEEDEIAVERFRREYETADMLEHPHIVKVVDFGETSDGQHFMTMEYLVGVELGHVLRTGGMADTPARALRMLAQVSLALEEAHAFGVIHRDLKPDNVFLCRTDAGDDVRILDFGSVKLQMETGPKLTAFGTTLGSPYYMSPEQAKGLLDVDTRTDIFAVGAILYECLSNKIAFEAGTVAEILMRIVRVDPDPISQQRPGLPTKLDAAIQKSLEKDKNQRYDTPSELVEAALAAYGVSGTCEEWAARPQSELEVALAQGSAPAEPSSTESASPEPTSTEPSSTESASTESASAEPAAAETPASGPAKTMLGHAAPKVDRPTASAKPASEEAKPSAAPAGSLPPPASVPASAPSKASDAPIATTVPTKSSFLLIAVAIVGALVFGALVAAALLFL